MTLVIQQEAQAVRVREWVTDLRSFRRWAKSDDFPTRGWYSHLAGELWVDLSMERLAHNQIKTKFAAVLTHVCESSGLGMFLGDRMLLTNVEAELSTEPDGMFISYEEVRAGRVHLEHGEDSVEVEGSPDMVLEVVRLSSREKDKVVLRDMYWRAGVREHWLVEQGHEVVGLEILRHGLKGYVAARKQGGWVKSGVFGKSFRLVQKKDPIGHPAYVLEVR